MQKGILNIAKRSTIEKGTTVILWIESITVIQNVKGEFMMKDGTTVWETAIADSMVMETVTQGITTKNLRTKGSTIEGISVVDNITMGIIL